MGLLAAGAHPVSMATVRMGPDGSVTVLVGTTELGQGARTVMAQIAAGVLKAPMNKVVVRGTDTRYTPYDRSTGASRSTTVAGLAVQRGPRRTSWTRCRRPLRPGWRPRRSCSPRPTAPSPIRTAGR